MDSISDSDSEDAGSIPAGATIRQWADKQMKEIKPLASEDAVFVFMTYPKLFIKSQFIVSDQVNEK
jgi:hypothetical protein